MFVSRAPACYFAAHDKIPNRILILMEDMAPVFLFSFFLFVLRVCRKLIKILPPKKVFCRAQLRAADQARPLFRLQL